MAPSSGEPTTWKVDGQSPRFGLDARGNYVDGYEVEFTTGLGNKGKLFVPRAGYNAQNVTALVKAHASELDTVSRSGS